VIIVGEPPLLHLADVLSDAGGSDLCEVSIALRELWLEVDDRAQKVVAEQDLAVGCASIAGSGIGVGCPCTAFIWLTYLLYVS
jgi:hypothetical protein